MFDGTIFETSVKKWDYEQQAYSPHESPESWVTPLTCLDMELVINCINCGKEIDFGSTYTSQVYHNSYGMGYNVCTDCHEAEMKERSRHGK